MTGEKGDTGTKGEPGPALGESPTSGGVEPPAQTLQELN